MCSALNIDYKFDPILVRHYHGNFGVAFHCHHYMANYTQLAMDLKDDNGPEKLRESAAEVFGQYLRLHLFNNKITDPKEIIAVAEHYWKTVGMGLVKFTQYDSDSLTAVMEYSHVDEGWLKKRKNASEPVNYVTQGYVLAVAGLLNGGGRSGYRAYDVQETRSLAKGDGISEFVVTKR
jgi:hypothetical protein